MVEAQQGSSCDRPPRGAWTGRGRDRAGQRRSLRPAPDSCLACPSRGRHVAWRECEASR
jgi:hypothetical protein